MLAAFFEYPECHAIRSYQITHFIRPFKNTVGLISTVIEEGKQAKISFKWLRVDRLPNNYSKNQTQLFHWKSLIQR